LRLLSEHAGVLTPIPVGIVPAKGGTILVLEAVRPVDRAASDWREIGRTLARIHKVEGDRFGLETNSYFGPLFQDNAPMRDWPAFYAERRLAPGLRLATDSGHLPHDLIAQVERVIARLPELCGPEIEPSLVHGDAQQNNFISTEAGAVVIDPAAYFGHPEVDLAWIDGFQPVPADVFHGYREERSIDPGFWERRDLWRIWGYLASVAVEGQSYLGQLSEAVRKYAWHRRRRAGLDSPVYLLPGSFCLLGPACEWPCIGGPRGQGQIGQVSMPKIGEQADAAPGVSCYTEGTASRHRGTGRRLRSSARARWPAGSALKRGRE
jgi:protein-ribulosamine 3-kinase